jgi:G3E family GTPase
MLAVEPQVDHLIVETTGLADPLPVGLTFLQTKLRSRTSLDAVVTVVDCANFALDLFKSDAAMAQIVHGDVRRPCDRERNRLAGAENLAIRPRTRILRAEYGRVPHVVMLATFDESGCRPSSALNRATACTCP